MDLLWDIAKISSSKLAGSNCWKLDPDVLLQVQEKEEEDKLKKAAIENQKEKQKQNDSMQFCIPKTQEYSFTY
jgi:hypothetical protein